MQLSSFRHAVSGRTTYRELTYDSLAGWIDAWYDHHYEAEQPANTIVAIAERLLGNRFRRRGTRILDAACGTGNPYIALSRAGLNVWATDGSAAMIKQAVRNCASACVSTRRMIRKPISWTEGETYTSQFGMAAFDIIVLGTNSFCHLPNTREQMGRALENFGRLLKKDGILIIDTKKYCLDGEAEGVQCHKELQFDSGANEWVVRHSRQEDRKLEGYGEVHFRTDVHHDIDYSFGTPLCRSIIVLTIFGPKLPTRVYCLPYYPLPAESLAKAMLEGGFEVTRYDAKSEAVLGWGYDVVVGRSAPH